MADETVLYSKKGHVACITLNRPDAGNMINEQLAGELDSLCRRVREDTDVYVAVLTGSGSVFCSGSELDYEMSVPSPARAVAAIEQPVIAAINGDAIGQGLELALACDIRLAIKEARFGLPHVSIGQIPTDGGTQRLPRIIGTGKALELILTSESIGTREAAEIGLVSKVIEKESLAAQAGALAQNLTAKAPLSLRFIKEAVNKGLDLTLEQGLRLEADLYFLLHTTADRTEGITAFLEKRTPRFKSE